MFFQAQVFTCPDCLKEDEFSWTVGRQDLTYIKSYLSLDLRDEYSMMEIAAPTCSYRMGEVNIGYTVVIIGMYYQWKLLVFYKNVY